MRMISEAIANIPLSRKNFYYCFEIRLQNNTKLFFTSAVKDVKNDNITYFRYSGLNVTEAFFNDSAKDHILIEGVFEARGIDKTTELLGAAVKIFTVFAGNFQHLVTYSVTKYHKYDLNFIIKLEPESIKYNQTILQKYSKTCRANFGDDRCCIDKTLYSTRIKIREIIGYNVILENIDKENGYFTGGSARIHPYFYGKILSHNRNTIKLDQIVGDKPHMYDTILLSPACDKKFITCCNKFNNAVNFRGEPSIPDQNFLKINF
jgi:uncharacterized phage protein (TIGR02218 family)